MENEIFKPISGYENLYEVSNTGKVKSLKKSCPRKDGKGNTSYPEKIMKQRLSPHGYLTISLCRNGKHSVFMVHRLVGFAFIDGYTTEKCQINHIDAVKDNNNVKNLEWVTHAENVKHACEMGLMFRHRTKGRFSKEVAA